MALFLTVEDSLQLGAGSFNTFSREQFDRLLGWRSYLADEHYPKFMSLIYGGWTVDEVLEGKGHPQLHVVGSSEEMEDVAVPDVIEDTDSP